tara:strand:+ start:140 stop:382 length:243 start_codon:yes stop_codon:yes gene_type:complete
MLDKCVKCNSEINPLRLKAIPQTKTCVNCSSTQRWYVRNIISGKTEYSEAEIIKDPVLAESIKNMDKRLGWGSNLNKVRR